MIYQQHVVIHPDAELIDLGDCEVIVKNPDGTAVFCEPNGQRTAMLWHDDPDIGTVYTIPEAIQ